MAWQPIDTAPKDREILAAEGGQVVYVIRWVKDGWYVTHEGEIVHSWETDSPIRCSPTEWQEMPSPRPLADK